MQAFRISRWHALTILFGLAAPAVRADLITPDSISSPPTAVGSANGTPVYANSFVTTQYAGVGLSFNGAAITKLNGVSVWAPVGPVTGNPSSSPSALLSYFGPWSGGKFVLPGTSTLTTVSSLSVELVGTLKGFPLNVYGLNGQQLNLLSVLQDHPGPHDGRVWTFTGAGIASFSGFEPVADGPPTPTWGVAEISFTPASTPEPSSLILAGLGALGLATRLGWRRMRRVA